MTHPPKAVETLALFICRNNHGHVDLDSLGIIARRMILLRATKICDIIAPFYVDRLRAENAELVAANTRLVVRLEKARAMGQQLVDDGECGYEITHRWHTWLTGKDE